ncbi:DUF998 domain-containing protein [Micromonospora sp. WMMC250]|nr:DUF998 domain-containing protein [Micromonospora sp. WMMC250]MCZ7373336.1 DUF998 domain-containing protein [Micromonospora sp. WMMC250]
MGEDFDFDDDDERRRRLPGRATTSPGIRSANCPPEVSAGSRSSRSCSPASAGSPSPSVSDARFTEGTGRRVLPIFVGIFGAGLIAAWVFTMDPEYGFPVGTPDGPVGEMSWHSIAHSAAAAIAFTALAVAAIVLTIRHVRRRATLPAVLNGLVALILLTPMSPNHMSIQIAVNGLVAFTWTTVVALSLRRTS